MDLWQTYTDALKKFKWIKCLIWRSSSLINKSYANCYEEYTSGDAVNLRTLNAMQIHLLFDTRLQVIPNLMSEFLFHLNLAVRPIINPNKSNWSYSIILKTPDCGIRSSHKAQSTEAGLLCHLVAQAKKTLNVTYPETKPFPKQIQDPSHSFCFNSFLIKAKKKKKRNKDKRTTTVVQCSIFFYHNKSAGTQYYVTTH